MLMDPSQLQDMDSVESSDLHDAVQNEDVKLVESLIEQQVNVNTMDFYGATALYLAVWRNNLEIAKILVGYGADVNKSRGERIPLHLAVMKGEKDFVKFLIEKGADVNAIDNRGMTPLQIAVKNCRPSDEIIIKILLGKGANISSLGIRGRTPLLHLIYYSEIRFEWLLDLLIQSGADINAKDIYGSTSLHKAVKEQDWAIINLLLEAGADINATTNEGETAPSLAIKLASELVTHDMSSIIYHKMISLKKAGFYLCEKNIQAMSNYKDRHQEGFWHQSNKHDPCLHELKCEQEVERIKRKLKTNLSLKLILTTNSLGYLRNESLAKQLESINYKDFPIYGNLLKCKWETDKRKLYLLEESKKSLKKLVEGDKRTAHLSIPSELLEKVVCCLSNMDLEDLILSAESI